MKILLRLISKLVFVILFVIAFFNNLNAQEKYKQSSLEVIKLINESQNVYSANDELINGCVYPLPNSRRQGDPYLKDQWTEASIYIKNNKYTKLFIKFDLVLGDVILKAELNDGVIKLVNLNKFQVDSFLIGNTLFVNSNNLSIDKKKITYLEQIYKGRYSLYKEYKKIFIKEYNNITPYGKYSSLKTDLYFIENDTPVNVDRKSSFLKNFGTERQNEIKSFMKKNKIKYSKASNQELIKLMIFCTNTSAN
ncbi:MAG: hypothetical protein GQ564_02030 [Bacteroidales bacterium]|nr:hypothetical protein [Bacteroidales bacterium]